MSGSLFDIIETIADMAQSVQDGKKPLNNHSAQSVNRLKTKKPDTKAKVTDNKVQAAKEDAKPDLIEQPVPVTNSDSQDYLNLSSMSDSDILRGLVFSEILGKPKSLRRGR
ncbi:MAG: hypothetical protein ACOYWZ_20935 [Bacillota bacterium]